MRMIYVERLVLFEKKKKQNETEIKQEENKFIKFMIWNNKQN